MASLLKLVHIGIAFAFVAGLVARWILLTRASRTNEVEHAFQLSEAAAPFERLVIWGGNSILVTGLATAWAQGYPWLGLTTGWMLLSVVLLLSVLPLVPLIFLPRGKRFESAMAAARTQGVVTPELRAAFADSAVEFARRYEVVTVAVVIGLMVLKPF